MAITKLALCVTLLTLLVSFKLSTSAYPPESDASPDISSTPESNSPSPSPDIQSPPAPPPLFHSPAPTPSDGDDDKSPTPTPKSDGPVADAPEPESDEWADNVKNGVNEREESGGGGDEEGMSGGKKAGIVIGVFAFVGFAVLGGLVYKKRRENVARAAYRDAVRREFL